MKSKHYFKVESYLTIIVNNLDQWNRQALSKQLPVNAMILDL